jgi:transketolase N-terminal domain/subunit
MAGHTGGDLSRDGEPAESSNWEAAMTATHYRLDNLEAAQAASA